MVERAEAEDTERVREPCRGETGVKLHQTEKPADIDVRGVVLLLFALMAGTCIADRNQQDESEEQQDQQQKKEEDEPDDF